jgi:hypothetical protein
MLFVGVFGCIAQQAVADTTTHFGGWQVFEGLTNPGNFPICMATSPEANIGRLVISFATRGDYPGKALLLITRQREWSNIPETAVGITLQFDDGRPVSSEWMTTKDLRVLARVEPAEAHPAVPGWSICSMGVPCAGDQRRAEGTWDG